MGKGAWTHEIGLTRRCSEPRAALRFTFCAFAIHPLAASHALRGSRSLILCLVRPNTPPMFLVPYRKTQISSPHPPSVIAERLGERTCARQPWFRSLVGRFDFIGSVSSRKFRLTPVIRGRNTYLPWLVGHIRPRPDGSTIHIVETFHPIQIAIIVGFFTFGGVVVGGKSSVWDAVFGTLLLFVIFHCVMYFIGFLPDARKAEERIRQLTA